MGVMDFGLTPQEAINLPTLGSFTFGKAEAPMPIGPLTAGVGDLDPDLEYHVDHEIERKLNKPDGV